MPIVVMFLSALERPTLPESALDDCYYFFVFFTIEDFLVEL